MCGYEILDAVEVPLFVIDVERSETPRFTHGNPAFAKLFKVSQTEILERSPADLFGHDSCRELVRASARRLSIALPPGSDHRHSNVTVLPVANVGGDIARFVGTVIVRSDNDAGDSDPRDLEREQYIAMAAHDLRAPMRNVGILTEELRDGFRDLGDGKLQLIDMLEDLGARASELIADVLAFTRAAGAAPGRHSEVDLSGLTGAIFGVLDPTGLHDLSAEDVKLSTDAVALQIVLRNLVDNALKHGDRDRMSLRISIEDVGEGMVGFAVFDNGRGFDDPALAFLDGGRFRYDTGFGLLGLKRLVEARGGAIAVAEPAEEKGTLIQFTLPGHRIVESALRQSDEAATGA